MKLILIMALLLCSSAYAIDLGLDEQRGVIFTSKFQTAILWGDIIGSKYIIDKEGVLDINESQLNLSSTSTNTSDYWDSLDTPTDINAGDITDDGTYLNTTDVLNVNSTTWWAGLTGYITRWFIKVGNDIQLNESLLNNTIDARDTNCTGSGCYPDSLSVTHNTTLNGSVDIFGETHIFHTATHDDDHAVEIIIDADGYGDVKGLEIFYHTGATEAGEDEEVFLAVIDDFESTGGNVAGFEVIATEGGAEVHGLEVGATVHPILQLAGTFTNMDSVLVKGVDRLSEFTSTASDIAIFVDDDDTVIIGNAEHFEEIEVILAVESSQDIRPEFRYSTGVNTWQLFIPTDGTDGFEHTGAILWEMNDVLNWVTVGGEYLINITRTRNNIVTVPVEDFIQIADVTEYEWDKDGNLTVRKINVTVELSTLNFIVRGVLNAVKGFFSGDVNASNLNATNLNLLNNAEIGGNITVGNDLYVADDTNLSDDVNVGGVLTVEGIVYANAIGTGFDVLHSATIGNFLDVGDDLTVGGVIDTKGGMDVSNLTGAWKTWTPTFAVTTLGNGAVTGRYTQSGKTIKGWGKFVLGSTSAVGSSPTMNFPVTAHATSSGLIGQVGLLDAGILWYSGDFLVASATTGLLMAESAVSSYVGLGVLTANIPFTWGDTDQIIVWFEYEAT